MSDRAGATAGQFWADVTGEHALDRYVTLVNMVDDGIYQLDAEGRFVAVNDTIAELTGYSREELLDEHASLILADEDASRIQREIGRRLTDDDHRDGPIEFTARTADDDAIPCELELQLIVKDGVFQGSMGVVRDITERKQAERSLRQERGLNEGIVETSPVGIAVVDADGNVTFTNERAAEIYGRSRDELSDFSHDDSRLDLVDENGEPLERGEMPFDRVVTREEAVRGQILGLHRPSGERVWVSVNGAPQRNEDGELEQAVFAFEDVTEQRENNRRLEESEARFRMLAENLEEMVWISDPESREILYLNPAYEDIWGRDQETLYEDPTTFLEAVHPDDRERVERAYATVPEEGFDEEYRIFRPDGEVRWLSVRSEPVRGEGRERVVGIAEDVTERKERERALEESERRYRTLVEHFPNGAVGLYNEDMEYTAVGGQLLGTTGVDPEDRIGNSVYEIYPDEVVETVEPYLRGALEGESGSFEIEYHNRHLHADTLPVRNADDEVFAGMLVVQDVTERQKYQRRLEESNERLEQFAYAASHDLQEPLRMVSSYLQLVESRYADELDEDGREFIEFAIDGADRMREMIEGLLQYSRVDTRGNPFESVDLDEVFSDVRQDLEVKVRETDADVTVGDLPRVHGDASQLNQVFQNLFSNALEYSGDEPPRVHVDAERAGDRWIVSVGDEGIGIDPADAERVFEVFQSLHGHEEAGTGIGLALVKRIVERHDGDIWVDSAPGEGATFSFTLPAADETDE